MSTFDFSSFPVLETDRLVLRQMKADDDRAVYEIRNDYQVTKYNIGDAYTDIRQAQTLIRNIQTEFDNEKTMRWGIVVKPQNKVIGMVGYNYWDQLDHRASIGFDLRQDHWRRGIMSEAVQEVLRFGFEDMRLNRVEADASIYNVGSITLLRKVGFLQEGVQREQYYEDGNYHDLILFALLKREWQYQQ